MPELPEVETTRRGIAPVLCEQKIVNCQVLQSSLRWPVPDDFAKKVKGRTLRSIDRRGKYLIVSLDNDQAFMLHLGMSGSLRITSPNAPLRKHDHVVFNFTSEQQLRFHDPRRFGCLLWVGGQPYRHKLLDHLGPEPLSQAFNADYLFERSRGRKTPIKNFVMDSAVVVGVGNIYANEALFYSGIHPRRLAGRVSLNRMELLVEAIKRVLTQAIEQGGTTLRDFVNGSGEPGYFQQSLSVYGREGHSCTQCDRSIRMIRLGQRATFYCSACQK